MADCFKYHEMISCLIDGELSSEEQSELNRHMAECEGCRSLLQIYKLAFNGSEIVEPPPELVPGSMLKVRAASAAAKRKSRKLLVRYVAAAACFALILLAVPHLPGSSRDVKEPQTAVNPGTVTDEYAADDYMASVTIDGKLPELLEGYTQTDAGNGSYTIKVRSYMVAYLAGLGYTPNYNSGSDSDWSVVIYNP